MEKKDICYNISSEAQISKDKSYKFFDQFIHLVSTKSKFKIVKISSFGSFYLQQFIMGRLGRNPKTKEEFIISKKILKLFFKASNKIKSIIN